VLRYAFVLSFLVRLFEVISASLLLKS